MRYHEPIKATAPGRTRTRTRERFVCGRCGIEASCKSTKKTAYCDDCLPIGKDPEDTTPVKPAPRQNTATKRPTRPATKETDDPKKEPAVVKPPHKDPHGALAAGGETTGTCTECNRPRRHIGQQDRICRPCRLNHAARKAL